MTLTEFLLARIAEDEAAIVEDGHAIDCEDAYGMHLVPERAHAECEAKRQIVERLAVVLDPFATEACTAEVEQAGSVLCSLASVYASHPDCREEWAR